MDTIRNNDNRLVYATNRRIKEQNMIEKIKSPLNLKVGNYKGTEFDIIPADTFVMVCRKINELVDAVNKQQKQIDKMSYAILDLATPNGENKALESIKAESKTPADPYAEQRKWIGSLVEYKLGDLFLYGILTDIKDGYTLPFVIDEASYTDDCWLPDESVIYTKPKENNNE